MQSLMAWIGQLTFYPAFFLIVFLTAIIYRTAFARRLPLLKGLVVYIFLTLGCLLLTLFHFMGFPMIPALFLTVLLIMVTRIRLSLGRKSSS